MKGIGQNFCQDLIMELNGDKFLVFTSRNLCNRSCCLAPLIIKSPFMCINILDVIL